MVEKKPCAPQKDVEIKYVPTKRNKSVRRSLAGNREEEFVEDEVPVENLEESSPEQTPS